MKKRTIISVDVDYFPGSEIGIFRLIELFDQMDAKAMFFVAGKYAEEYDDVISRIHSHGHEIGCHGYSHGLDVSENFVDMEVEEQRRRIEKSSRILKRLTKENVRPFRAPYAKANHRTIGVLESLGYEYDSSVTSMRFDFGMGVSNNVRAFFAPRRPYHPSQQDLFREGDSRILEVPISAFFVPFTLTALRTFGMERVKYIYNISKYLFDPVVFYLHPWEVMETDEIRLWEGIPKRHVHNRGSTALTRLKKFMDYVRKKSDLILFKDVLREGLSHEN
jgi:peptidoglycan/xylan/chitin deacetylase (PgdA/CDA1 family)